MLMQPRVHGRVAGDQAGVIDAGRGAGEIGDDAAGLANQQNAGGDVPGRERELPEALEAAARRRARDRATAAPGRRMPAVSRMMRGSISKYSSTCSSPLNGNPVPMSERAGSVIGETAIG